MPTEYDVAHAGRVCWSSSHQGGVSVWIFVDADIKQSVFIKMADVSVFVLTWRHVTVRAEKMWIGVGINQVSDLEPPHVRRTKVLDCMTTCWYDFNKSMLFTLVMQPTNIKTTTDVVRSLINRGGSSRLVLAMSGIFFRRVTRSSFDSMRGQIRSFFYSWIKWSIRQMLVIVRSL